MSIYNVWYTKTVNKIVVAYIVCNFFGIQEELRM